MAMNVNIKEVRPRRHYFWIFGLSILILTGVILTKYDLPNDFKISSFLVPGSEQIKQAQPTHVKRDTEPVIKETSYDNYSKQTPLFSNDSKVSINVHIRSRPISKSIHRKTNKTKSREIHDIVYAKVHKAASSVIQNMLLRFALSRKLNVLLPIKGHLLSETSSHIDKHSLLPLPKGERYNILCNHVIFNKQEMNRFFPKSTAYIGILRHPLRQVSSALFYYAKRYKKSRYSLAFWANPNNPLLAFLSKPYQFDLDIPKNSFVNNRMSIDLGFPISGTFESDKRDQSKIATFLKDVSKNFDLILIVELFDESLILLRRLLHWKTEDILYMKLNVNSDPEALVIDQHEEELHKRWAPMDYALYDHFRETLENEIVKQGEDFRRELESYKKIQRNTVNFCQSVKQPNETEFVVKRSKWSPSFVVTENMCKLMNEGETSMVAIVKQKQKQRLGLTDV